MKLIVTVVTALFLLPTTSEDLAGAWNLVSVDAKPAAARQMTIAVADGRIITETTISEKTGTRTITRVYVPDGKEYSETITHGNERFTRTKWEKDSLKARSTLRPKRDGVPDLSSPMRAVVTYIDETFTLSADKKRLTIVTKISGIVGDLKRTEVYEKAQ